MKTSESQRSALQKLLASGFSLSQAMDRAGVLYPTQFVVDLLDDLKTLERSRYLDFSLPVPVDE